MAKHSHQRAYWQRREARKRVRIGGWWAIRPYESSETDPDEEWKEAVQETGKLLHQSIHGCMSQATRRYRRLWRSQAHEICRLHLLQAHDQADDLDPQPRRLGVMWDIW